MKVITIVAEGLVAQSQERKPQHTLVTTLQIMFSRFSLFVSLLAVTTVISATVPVKTPSTSLPKSPLSASVSVLNIVVMSQLLIFQAGFWSQQDPPPRNERKHQCVRRFGHPNPHSLHSKRLCRWMLRIPFDKPSNERVPDP